MKFTLQRHNTDAPTVLNLTGLTVEFLTPAGAAAVSGPSPRHALMRAVDAVVGAQDITAGFSLTPAGQPTPAQWRHLADAAKATLDAPDDDVTYDRLAAAVHALGTLDPVTPTVAAAPSEGAPSEELLNAVDELAGLILRETLWRASIDYCKALAASFSPKAAAPHAVTWERAKALATKVADLVASARPPKAAKPKR